MPAQQPTRQEALERLFRRSPVADLGTLQRVLGTPSRTTVFRALCSVGYLTSYSHAGRYYTLQSVPRFDADGLWAHGGVLFSKHRTLRATIVQLVNQASAGHTHEELQARLQLRVHDTLRSLVEDAEIGRTDIDRLFLYVSIEPATAEAQVAEMRRRLAHSPSPASATLPDPGIVIEVLLAFIHHPKPNAAVIASVLHAQGKASREQVDAVWTRYQLGEKKRASRPSRP
jgi:hypothetical protein